MNKRKLIMMLMLAAGMVASAMNAGDRRTEKRDSILANISGAAMPAYKVSIAKFGAKGDGKTDCKPAFDRAMKKAKAKGGMHIVVPEGAYFVKGPIHFTSNVCLELEKGATLKFSPDAKDYLPMVSTSWEGTFLYNYSPMLYGYGVHDVTLMGEGTIDGNCAETFATWKGKQKDGQALSRKMNHENVPVEDRRFGEKHWLRPQLVQFFNCKNITVKDVFITNSPFWCLHLLKSENIICKGIRYDAKLINNDGIDPECSRNILIEDIHFNNGDDNIAIKSGRDNDGWHLGTPSENIVIRKCHFKGLHAVVIGSEMSAGVRNVFMEDCDYAGYCKRGIYIKTNPDRGGFVRDIYVNDCVFDEVEDLFYITSMYHGEGMESGNFTDIEGIHVDGLRCRKAKAGGLILQGTEKKPIRDVSFKNVNVEEVHNAISFEHCEGVTMRDCFIGGKAGVPSHAK